MDTASTNRFSGQNGSNRLAVVAWRPVTVRCRNGQLPQSGGTGMRRAAAAWQSTVAAPGLRAASGRTVSGPPGTTWWSTPGVRRNWRRTRRRWSARSTSWTGPAGCGAPRSRSTPAVDMPRSSRVDGRHANRTGGAASRRCSALIPSSTPRGSRRRDRPAGPYAQRRRAAARRLRQLRRPPQTDRGLQRMRGGGQALALDISGPAHRGRARSVVPHLAPADRNHALTSPR